MSKSDPKVQKPVGEKDPNQQENPNPGNVPGVGVDRHPRPAGSPGPEPGDVDRNAEGDEPGKDDKRKRD